MVAVVKVKKLYTCFSLFHHGVSYFWVFLSQNPTSKMATLEVQKYLIKSKKYTWQVDIFLEWKRSVVFQVGNINS